MELKEKITKVSELKENQKALKDNLVEAEKNNNEEEVNRLKKEIDQITEKIKEVNAEYQQEMGDRPEEEKIGEEAASFLSRGKGIDKEVEDYTAILNKDSVSADDKAKAREKIEQLKANKNRLKGEIYGAALKKSGLDYIGGEISPGEVIKKAMQKISELEEERKKLEAQKEKQKEVAAQKKSDMDQQFNIATEKYKEMLDSGKISLDLYEKRMISMREAKEKDTQRLESSFEDFDKKLEVNSNEIASAKEEFKDSQAKFKIYDEYDKVFYDLFGEPLDKFAKERYEIIQNSVSKPEEAQTETAKPKSNSENRGENGANNTPQNENSKNGQNVAQVVQTQVAPEIPEEVEEESVTINITSKTMFDTLYKKLSRGNISDEELKALTRVLENEDNYDKYGITTGLVFNKAKKILKEQGARTAKDIEAFLAKSGKFSSDIVFDTSIEGEDVLSHDLLNSWKDISNQLVFTEKELSVEKYINEIEKYKEEGNTLTKEQEKMYKEATRIKGELTGYKKAINTTEAIAVDRDFKMHNSVFYNMFKNFGKGRKNALPEVSTPSRDDEVPAEKVLDLSTMVQDEVDDREVETQEVNRDRNIDDDVVR